MRLKLNTWIRLLPSYERITKSENPHKGLKSSTKFIILFTQWLLKSEQLKYYYIFLIPS